MNDFLRWEFRAMPHLLVDISHHGYGHIAQTAPVVNALRQRFPELQITVRCPAPHDVLARAIEGEFRHIPQSLDGGMAMASAMDVDVQASARAYRELHRDWERKLAEATRTIAGLKPDLLLANVPYLPLAAAPWAGVPAVALSSLNWADIYFHYCQDVPGAREIHSQMLRAYASAQAFLKPRPALPMGELANAVEIGPIARTGIRRRAEIAARLRLAEGERLVLIALGGIPTRLPVERWPCLEGVRWLAPAAWQVQRPDAVAIEPLGFAFIDLLASCDAVIAKPGYGTFAEAACNGIPVLTLPRPDWPETPFLTAWLKEHGRCLVVEREELERGELQDALGRLLALPPKPTPAPTGIAEAAQILERLLA